MTPARNVGRARGAPHTARPVSFHPADHRDLDALARLRAASLCELGLLAPERVTAFVPAARHALRALLARGELRAYVACDGERAVASACVVLYDRLPYPEGTRHAEVAGVYVEPRYRGRGVARELVRAAVDAATAAGARRVFLAPSPGARDLYARLGFVEYPAMRLA